MKLSTLAILSTLVAAPVMAQPIFIDIGTDFDAASPNTNYVAGPTTTGWLTELQFNYNSWSTVKDTNGNGLLDAGDVITSTGGLKGSGFNNFLALYGNNSISSFLPQQFGAFGPSNNGYKNGWELSFGFDDLVGTIDGMGGVTWTSGTISFYATTDIASCAGANNSSCFTRLFDMTVTNGGNIPSATLLSGYLSNFNTTDMFGAVVAGDVFNTQVGGVNKSFRTIHDELALKGEQQSFNFLVDQNVAALPAVTGYDPVSKTFTLAPALHDGSLSFSVSEPTSLAVLGLGLLGFGFARRNKKA